MTDLILISLSVSAAIAVMLALSPLLGRRYGAKWRYIVWLALAVRLLIPFRFELPYVTVRLPAAETVVVRQTAEPGVQPLAQTEPETVPVQQRKDAEHGALTESRTEDLRRIDTDTAMFSVWAAGAALFFGVHAVSYLLFKKRVRPFCVREYDRVYRCGRIAGPVLVGFFKPMILLPEGVYTDEEKEIIIKHETAHFRRGDMWYKLILLIANSVHWFNPLVYLMVRMANRDLEYACDDAVVRGMGAEYRKLYSMVILKTMESVKGRRE